MPMQSHPVAALVAIAILIVLLIFFLFMLFLLLHGEHRRNLPCQLAANTIFSHLLFGLFLHPFTIHLQMYAKPVTTAFCWLCIHMDYIYQMITPYLLFMFTVERLMFIKDPIGHAQKIKRAGAITLLVFPWVLTILYALIAVNALSEGIRTEHHYTSYRGANETGNVTVYYTCYNDVRRNHHFIDIIFRHLLGDVIPFFASLIITITVLIMWCCFKRRRSLGTDYSMLGERVEATVRDSVIAVSVLNFLYIVVFIAEEVTGFGYIYDYGFFSLFGVIEGVVWIGTLADVRCKFVGLFKCCCPRKYQAEPAAVDYHAKEPCEA